MTLRLLRLLVLLGVAISALGRPAVATAQRAPAGDNAITAMAFSADGRLIAAGLRDSRIVVWDAASGQQLRAWVAHQGAPVSGLAFSPDGTTIASGGRDSALRLWDAATGKLRESATGHEQPIREIAYSPDGRSLATTGEDSRVVLWDAAPLKLRRILFGHINFSSGLAFSPDGATLASAGEDAQIILWDAASGRQRRVLRGHQGGVGSIGFDRSGSSLASFGADAQVRLWDPASGRLRQVLGREHTGRGRTLAFSPDGTILASGGDDRKVVLWDIGQARPRRTLLRHSRGVTRVAFSPNGTILATAGEDQQIILWEVATGRELRVLAAPPAQPTPPTRPVGAADGAPGASPGSPAALSPPLALEDGPGGPILVITHPANKFGTYYAEILRSEGLNAFTTADIGSVTAATLAAYDVAILAEMPLTSAQASMLSDWVTGGGNLIAMRPAAQLAGLLGLSSAGSPLTDAYLRIATTQPPGTGLVDETIQFHGPADRYSLSGATSIATLYTSATAPTSNPAVTLRSVGTNGGQAAAFTYDLAKSVIYSRQGNPAWREQERDGFPPIRSDDLYFGAAAGDVRPDWVDLNKVQIPQADEQQRLLVNLILEMTRDRKPLPRFWYFPRGERAVVVLTGDDHGNGGTGPRFDQQIAASPAGCSVEDWECVRSTSYIYAETPLTDAQAAAYHAQGFEISIHVETGCQDFSAATLSGFYDQQLSAWQAKYTSIPAPATHRTHCLVWSDWSSQPNVQLARGMRLDTTYYYWPPSWVLNRPGFFTASGLPQRFADLDGTLIDVYQAPTQMTDESGQSYPFNINSLLDRAIGPEGYYGAFVVNAHTDAPTSPVADSVVASALARSVPVVSAKQLLDWWDGRNSSTFSGISWNGSQLSFTVSASPAARGLQMLIPASSSAGAIQSITRNGAPVSFTLQGIKGAEYAVAAATSGSYVVTYAADTTAPTVQSTEPANGATGVAVHTTVAATFSEAMDPATVGTDTFELRDGANALVPATVTYDAASRTATLTPDAPLAAETTYTATVRGGAADPRAKDVAGNPLASSVSWSFTTAAAPVCPCTIWPDSATPAVASDSDPNSVELGVKFRSEMDGFITGVRFYKGPGNTGTHVGSLWTASGTRLAQATFTNETASGWQTVSFASPVPIQANTTYIASYYAPNGGYAVSSGFFAGQGVFNPPLRALQDGADGPNGVYLYGAGGGFPSFSYQSTNYWVDVVFTPGTSDTTPPTVSGHSPAAGATGVAVNTSVTATFSEPIDPATVGSSTFELRDGANALVPATVTYDAASRTATLTPSAALAASTTYTARVRGGATDPRIKDLAGNALAADVSWSFTSAAASVCPCTIWPDSATPAVASDSDPNSVELGVRFRADTDGFITGVRFYKGPGNTGTHIGSLWTTGGTRLANATFTNETASGWQTVSFATPVPIQANTTYIASYHAPNGNYSADTGYFADEDYVNPPLRALRDGADGPNGVYAYGPAGSFPNQTWEAANYYVDVVFTTEAPSGGASLTLSAARADDGVSTTVGAEPQAERLALAPQQPTQRRRGRTRRSRRR